MGALSETGNNVFSGKKKYASSSQQQAVMIRSIESRKEKEHNVYRTFLNASLVGKVASLE